MSDDFEFFEKSEESKAPPAKKVTRVDPAPVTLAEDEEALLARRARDVAPGISDEELLNLREAYARQWPEG